MKNKDAVNIYWAPYYSYNSNNTQDWSMLYPDPKNMYSEISKNKVINDHSFKSFFTCPAVKNNFKNTYVFKNVVHSEYTYNTENSMNITPISKTFLGYEFSRKPAISDGPIIKFSLSYIFFADQDVEALFTSPTFHKPKYTNYGTIFPGEFNIGSWFRPYHLELQMWNSNGNIVLEENEPIFYVKFLTNKNIKLHRFNFNKKLHDYATHCSESSNDIKSNIPLIERYQMFKNSRMHTSILNEIKNNIVGEENE